MHQTTTFILKKNQLKGCLRRGFCGQLTKNANKWYSRMQIIVPTDCHTKKNELGRNETLTEIMAHEWFLKWIKHRLI